MFTSNTSIKITRFSKIIKSVIQTLPGKETNDNKMVINIPKSSVTAAGIPSPCFMRILMSLGLCFITRRDFYRICATLRIFLPLNDFVILAICNI